MGSGKNGVGKKWGQAKMGWVKTQLWKLDLRKVYARKCGKDDKNTTYYVKKGGKAYAYAMLAQKMRQKTIKILHTTFKRVARRIRRRC